MNEKPLVSIVTPSFNQGSFLEETISSVLAQTYQPIEYIVIDGGSTDDSVEIIQKHADRLTYWVSEPDRGQSHAINKGLQRSTGAVIGWLNSDDTLMPGTVARVVDAMEQDPMVVHGSVRLIDADSKTIARPKLAKRNQEFGIETIVGEGLVNQPGSFWNRAIMERVGYLNEDLNYIMDFELWVRMALGGARFLRLGDPPLATYRLTSDTKTVGSLYKVGLEKLAVLDWLMSDAELAAKIGLSSDELESQAKRARSLASLKVARGYAHLPGRRTEALRWLARAAWLWPPCLLLFPEQLVKRLWVGITTRLGADAPTW
ncbi:MAG: glycosyltransferase family 2 protein [Anaerolineae bacterium]